MQTGSGSVQLTKQSPYLTDLSLRTLGLLFNVPDTAQNATRLDLPALLNQLAHTSLYSAVPKGSDRRMWFGPGPLVSCVFFLQQHTEPKQQLLEQLELHTMNVIVLSVLDWLESPHFASQPAFLDLSGPVFEVATCTPCSNLACCLSRCLLSGLPSIIAAIKAFSAHFGCSCAVLVHDTHASTVLLAMKQLDCSQ